jgi:hypothetical protein
MGNNPFVNANEGSTLAPTSAEQRRKIAGARAFIPDALASGPQRAGQVLQSAADCGKASGTFYDAKRALGARSTRRGYQRPWVWTWPGGGLHNQPHPLQRHKSEVIASKAYW